MSTTLRYLDENTGKAIEGDAAQAFLQNKLRKPMHGRYTQAQIDRLHANGGPSIVNANEGAIPAGEYYDSLNPTKNGGDGGAAGGSGGGDYSWMEDSGKKTNYTRGTWGKGEMNAEELAEKYGLDRSKEGRGEGHIWGTNADGSEVYIGKSSMDLASNKDLISAHANQTIDEVDHSGVPEDLSSLGDIKGAILNQWKAGGGKKGGGEEKENQPIRQSDELKQAISRVRTYENDVLSGKISDDIFGGASAKGTYGDMANSSFDHNKGIDGIGTERGAVNNIEAKATGNFLESKKNDVKKAYNFQPAS